MRIAYIFLFTLLSGISISQNKQERREIALKQINELHNGVLLIRLQNKQKVVDGLIKKGFPKKANFIKEKQLAINNEIALAFKDFKFCKVYFFYSQFSDSIKNKKFNNVSILNDSLKEIETEITKFYIADFSKVKTNYKKQKTDNRTDRKKSQRPLNPNYSGGSQLNVTGLILSDSDFNQLKKPFPFYVRKHPTPLHNLTNKQLVDKLNDNLFKMLK